MMKKNKYSVSVCISAFNEEQTIKEVLKDVLAQQARGWSLKEILVYCDGCTDATFEKVISIKSKKVKAIDGKTRKGKVGRVNQAIREFTADILVIFDADIKLGDANVISELVSQFENDSKTMFVSGNSRVFPPRTFFERAIYSSYLVYYDARENLKSGHNVFGCSGACLALRRQFAKTISIPNVINEDTFLYFTCLSKGYKFRHAKDARLYYKLAGNLKDFVKQIFRTHPEAIAQNYQKYFGELIKKEYRRPPTFYLKSILKAFGKNPLGTAYMFFIKCACIPLFPVVSKRYKLDWYTAGSTKKVSFSESPKQRIIISSYDDIGNPYYAGGGSIAVHEIAKRFAKENKVTVYTGRYPGSIDEIKEQVEYRRIGAGFGGPKFDQLIYHLVLPFYVFTQKYDLWIESFTPPISTSFLQLFTKKPVIGLVHMLSSADMRRKYKLPFHLVERLGLKTYRRFIVLTSETKNKISEINKSANIKIIPNGVSLPKKKNNTRADSILFIGRIEVNQKGLDLLLSAFKRISIKSDLKLQIAGSGTKKEEYKLKRLIDKLNLQASVEYLGRVSGRKKTDVLSKAQLLIIPSRFETFPLTALEALSYGIPIVAFDIEGLNWLSENCAYKVKAFDEKELAGAILKLTKNRNLRKKMSQEGKKFVGKYNWDRVFEKYYQFVTQTIALNNNRLLT